MGTQDDQTTSGRQSSLSQSNTQHCQCCSGCIMGYSCCASNAAGLKGKLRGFMQNLDKVTRLAHPPVLSHSRHGRCVHTAASSTAHYQDLTPAAAISILYSSQHSKVANTEPTRPPSQPPTRASSELVECQVNTDCMYGTQQMLQKSSLVVSSADFAHFSSKQHRHEVSPTTPPHI